MLHILRRTILSSALPWLVLLPSAAHAQNPDPSGIGAGITAAQTFASGVGLPVTGGAVDYIAAVLYFLLGFVAILALLMIVIGGIMYVISLGDQSRTERAKKIITFAVVGVLIVGLSFLVVRIVQFLITGV